MPGSRGEVITVGARVTRPGRPKMVGTVVHILPAARAYPFAVRWPYPDKVESRALAYYSADELEVVE